MLLRGSVRAFVADPEYDEMAHVNVRDSVSGYWFSLARSSEDSDIEVMVSDQLNHRGDGIQVTLEPQAFHATLSDAVALQLDGNRYYVVEFPVGQYASIRSALDAIFRGREGLSIGRSGA